MKDRGTMVFAMGLPASGKTTIMGRMFPTARNVDPDEIKTRHPDYNPRDPQPVHEWSTAIEEQEFNAALASTGLWVIDGTGTNAEKMVRRMTQAKAMGWTVELVYITVSLATSLKRNAARERNVPEEVIRAKALDIATSFQIVAPHADKVTTINNEGGR